MNKILEKIRQLKFKDFGFGGECLPFAVAIRNLLGEGEYYAIWESGEVDPYHVLILYRGYFIDSNTIKNEKDYISMMKKLGRRVRKLSYSVNGKETPVEEVTDKKEVERFIQILSE